jgi:hypothetical protein
MKSGHAAGLLFPVKALSPELYSAERDFRNYASFLRSAG